MSCESVTRDLPLYVYGELPGEDEERVEAHVHSCETCRQELEAQRRLHSVLDRARVELPPELLADCRSDLMYQVRRNRMPEPERGSWRDRMFSFWGGFGVMRQPAGALALVALGFFAARFMLQPAGQFGAQPAGQRTAPELVVSTIRSVQPDADPGRVQIAFDETRRRVLNGSLDDQNIQRLLLSAARDEANAGLRVDSIDLLKNHSASTEVHSALLAALGHDSNAGVRLKALEGLKSMSSDEDTRRALVRALLTDNNPGVRVQAIDLLMQQRDESLVGVLQSVVRKDQNNYVRLKCQNALQEMNASVGTF